MFLIEEVELSQRLIPSRMRYPADREGIEPSVHLVLSAGEREGRYTAAAGCCASGQAPPRGRSVAGPYAEGLRAGRPVNQPGPHRVRPLFETSRELEEVEVILAALFRDPSYRRPLSLRGRFRREGLRAIPWVFGARVDREPELLNGKPGCSPGQEVEPDP